MSIITYNKGERVDKMVWVSISSVKEVWDPFSIKVWDDLESPITIKEIMECIINNSFACEYLAEGDLARKNRDYHIKRIAYFVVNGWKEPIQIDVRTTIPKFNEFKIFDGKHRLVAAIFKFDSSISSILRGMISEKEEKSCMNYIEHFRYA